MVTSRNGAMLACVLVLSVAHLGREVAAQVCGEEWKNCDTLAYCENVTVGGVYQDFCLCEAGTIGDLDYTANDPPFTSGTCSAAGYTIRYVTTVADIPENPIYTYTSAEAFALCQAGAKGYFLRNIQSKLEVNCLYPSLSAAQSDEDLYAGADVGPEIYLWELGTTSQALRIPPTGMTVENVHFKPNCANSGCWIISGTMTTGEAYNNYDVFNTFFLPQTDLPNNGALSYDYDYSAVEWTFQPSNHPCTSVDYEPEDSIFRVSFCCIDKPDVGPAGGFIANYRPTQNFVDWQQGFACDRRFVSVTGTTKCWKYMSGLEDTWQQADARCRVAGGFLPSIANQAENDMFMDMAIERGMGRTWLGGYDRQNEGNFSWVDGSAGPGVKGDQFYDNWHGNNPNEGGPAPFQEDCMEMYLSRGLLWGTRGPDVPTAAEPGSWNDKECAEYRFGYFCQFEGGGGCLEHVVQRPSHSAPAPDAKAPCYAVQDSMLPYDAAQLACEAQGGHLARVFSPEDFYLMRRLLVAEGASEAWIGLDDKETEGSFKWANSTIEFDVTPPYPFMGWKVGYPKSFIGTQGVDKDCVMVHDDGYWWQDRACTELRKSVCELPRGDAVCDSDRIPNEDPLYDVPFPVSYESFMLGAFKGMNESAGITRFDNLDPFFGQFEFEIELDEVELRTKAAQLRGTVGVEYTIDTFLGLTNFRPTGGPVLDTFSTQTALHLERTNFFSVSTHGVNDYTFLEYVNLRLVTVLQEDESFGDSAALDRTVRTSRTDNVNYVQVTFTLQAKFGVNDEPENDVFSSGLIPLNSVRAGRGTFFSTVELEHVCQGYAQAGDDDIIGLSVGEVSRSMFDSTLAQTCGPQADMCSSPSSIPDQFVSFNIPLGTEVLEGEESQFLDSQIFVDLVINAIDTDARARDTTPNDGEDPWQAKTTLSASIPIVEGGVNIFCDGFTSKTDLKDVANADIVVGSAANGTELTRLRIIANVASTSLDSIQSAAIDTDSIEAALMTLVLKGDANYFTSAGPANTGGYSLELDDLITLHLMDDDGTAGTVDSPGGRRLLQDVVEGVTVCDSTRTINKYGDCTRPSNGCCAAGLECYTKDKTYRQCLDTTTPVDNPQSCEDQKSDDWACTEFVGFEPFCALNPSATKGEWADCTNDPTGCASCSRYGERLACYKKNDYYSQCLVVDTCPPSSWGSDSFACTGTLNDGADPADLALAGEDDEVAGEGDVGGEAPAAMGGGDSFTPGPVASNSKEGVLIRLLAELPEDNSDSNGLDTDGYQLNGAFRFDIDRAAGVAMLNPTQELLDICPFAATRPAGAVSLESCIMRRDVRDRGFPVRGGASPTAMEILKQTGLLVSDDVSDELLALEAQRVPDDCGCDETSCCEAGFMQSLLGENDYARDLAVGFVKAIHERYDLNGRWTRAFWINPGYEWTPTQTGGRAIFSVSQKLYVFALISLDENVGRRRMLLATDPTVGSGAGAGAANLQFPVTQKSIMASTFDVPLEKVATFSVGMQLTQQQACMADDELQSSLQGTLIEYLATSASAFHSVHVTGFIKDMGNELCSRRALRRLLADLSSASASVRMMVIYKEEGQATFNPAAFADMPGITSVEADATNTGLILDSRFEGAADGESAEEDGGLNWKRALIVAVSAGMGGCLLMMMGVICYIRRQGPGLPAGDRTQSAVVFKVDKDKDGGDKDKDGGEIARTRSIPRSIRFAETPTATASAGSAGAAEEASQAAESEQQSVAAREPALDTIEEAPSSGSRPLSLEAAAAPPAKKRPPSLLPMGAPPAAAPSSTTHLPPLPHPAAHYDFTRPEPANAPLSTTMTASAAGLPPLPEPVAHYDCTGPEFRDDDALPVQERQEQERPARDNTDKDSVVSAVVNIFSSIVAPSHASASGSIRDAASVRDDMSFRE